MSTTTSGSLKIPSEEVLLAREKVVLDHFRDEVAKDWDGALWLMETAKSEPIISILRTIFPDQRHEIISLRHSHDAVIVEFWLLGTHLGNFGPIPPTGKTHRTRTMAFFIFDENENLVIERIYYDRLTAMQQLLNELDPAILGRVMVGIVVGAETPDPRLTGEQSKPADD
ncbi:hypothetical protein C8J57DRAFT_1519549 [Mycena rebaudengoi]|nr:hypothetical protein C8J57DRAFT_1519549 [Mycena rebaudengoi]